MNNVLNIISVSDIHFGHKDPEKLYNELKSNLLDKIDENLDLIVINGDLFHKKLSLNSKTSRLSIKFITDLHELSIKNDFKIRLVQGTYSHDLDQLKNFEYLVSDDFKIIYKPEVEFIGDNKILYIPEEYPKNMVEHYKDYFNQKYDLIFLHGTFKFTAFSNQIIKSEKHIKSAPVFDETEFRNMCDGFVICGHIHVYTDYKKFIYYGGSFTRTSHGEESPKGYLKIKYTKGDSNNSYVERVINEDAPVYKTVDMNKVDDMNIDDLNSYINDLKNKYDYLSIKNVDRDKISTKILQKINSGDSSIKIETVKRKEDVERDESYDFILNRDLNLPEEIQKFIEMNYDVKIDLDTINDFIN